VPRIKDWFTRSAIAAFIALVAVGYGWYLAAVSEFELSNNKVQSAEQKARTDLVKDLLGKAISTGNDLVQGLPNQQDDFTAEHAVEAWADRTRDLISAAYGNGEATLFMDSSGYIFYTDGSARQNLRNFVDGRMRRLSELVQRSDSVTVRTEFDPTRFRQARPWTRPSWKLYRQSVQRHGRSGIMASLLR
jgi:hypothetical protein